jgi:16S rRNA (cytosine967-C5)-methyltransferase
MARIVRESERKLRMMNLQRQDPATKPKPVTAEAARLEAMNVPGLAARLAAAAVLRDVIVVGHGLDELFAPRRAVPSRLAGLEGRDRALTRSIATVALRRLGTIRQTLSTLLAEGLPRSAAQVEWTLIVAAAQILFLDVPDHAAVDLAVRITRLDPKGTAYAGLVNAVLRNLIRQRDSFLAQEDTELDTPAWLAARWRKNFGEATAHAVMAANRMEPTLDITVNADPLYWASKLDATILPTGSLRLSSHAPIQELPGYDEGAWFVQDAAAALPAQLIPVAAGAKIGDLCSAPGGKAAQLAARGAHVTAIDRSAERLKLLAANFERLRLEAEIVVADVMTLKGYVFDAVLVDAPCTGTGTIQRHPDIAWTKKQSDIATLAGLQARMLDKAFELVKPGGTIVYCTCSLEPEEGELQIPAFLRRNPDVVRQPIGAEEIGGCDEFISESGDLRTLPSQLAGPDPRLAGVDGFFAARLIRRK